MKPPLPSGISPSMGRTFVLLGVSSFLMVNLFFLCEAVKPLHRGSMRNEHRLPLVPTGGEFCLRRREFSSLKEFCEAAPRGGSPYLPNISRMPSKSNARVKRRVWSKGLLCAVDMR